MLNKLTRLWHSLRDQEKPARYLFTRIFVNFPYLFSKFYFHRNGYKVLMSPNSIAANFFIFGDSFLSYDEHMLKYLLGQGRFFVDVGANIGHLSLALSCSSHSSGVAIEANPRTFRVLFRNVKINLLSSKVKCLNYAVGESDNKDVEISDSFADDCNFVVHHQQAEDLNGLYIVPHNYTHLVKSRTLDSLAKEHQFPTRVRLLKIDVEGYELFAFKGATNLIKSTEIIYFEYWDKLTQKYGYDNKELFGLIESYNFKLYYAPEINEAIPLDDLSLKPISESHSLSTLTNIIAVNLELLKYSPNTKLTLRDLVYAFS
jgi:FkbM family methyltransferase